MEHMKHIYMIRHGRQDSKLCNVDVPLSPEGREQAELLAERLKDRHFDKIYSSVLLRAMETADIINAFHGMEIERRSELNEIDWGDLMGKSEEEMKEQYGSFLEKRASRTEDIRFPGGENGADVFRRASKVFREIEESDWKSILLVVHGGMIRAMIPGLLGFDEKSYLAFGRILENTSITELLYDEKTGRYSLERFNDWAHLSSRPDLTRAGWGITLKA